VALLPSGGAAWSGAVDEAALASRVLDHIDRLLALVDEVRAARPGAEPGPLVMARARLAGLLYYSGRYDLADDLLAEIEPLEAAIQADPGVRAMWRYARGLREGFGGRPEAALRESEAALAAFDDAGNLRRACNMQVLVAQAWLGVGDGAQASTLVQGAIGAAESMGLHNVAS